MRRMLPQLLLVFLALAGPTTAQIAMPEGVALSPLPVSQQPAAYVAFGDGGGGIWAVFQGAAPGSGLYAQHIVEDGSYALGFNAAARLLAAPGTLVNNLSAGPDGVGGAVITWFGVNPKDSTSHFLALRYLRINAEGAIPPPLPDTGIVVSKVASAGMVVGDGLGGAYVAWEELKSPPNPDIVAQHYNDFGVPIWVPSGSATGRNVCAVVGIQRLRAIQNDGSGGAYVVWADTRTASTSPLYAMRLLPAGLAGAPWTTNGVRITPIVPGIRIAGSGTSPAGGLWLAWRDINVANELDAQHVTNAAAFQWGATGAVVTASSPVRVDFVAQPSGDVFVTWGDSDIRCSRMSAAGVRVWPEPAGRVMVTPPTGTLNVRVIADGAGGQRLAWSFDNAGQTDVNLMRVDGSGTPWPGEPPLGDPFEATSAPEEPVAVFVASSGDPVVVWLSAGVMRARRVAGTTLGVGHEGHAGPKPALSLSAPAPNPLRGSSLTLHFAAPAGPARLDLFDAAGRRVLARMFYSSGGAQALSLDGVTALAPGVYTLRLAAAGHVASQRLVRVE